MIHIAIFPINICMLGIGGGGGGGHLMEEGLLNEWGEMVGHLLP